MQNLMMAICLAVAASAYEYSGPGLGAWPSTGGYGYGSTCWGCHGYRIGKRSAEPYGYGGGLGYGVALTVEDRNNVWGHELASGYAINQPHPGHAGSHQAITKLHSGFGKRSILGHGVAVTVEDNNNLHGHELASGYAINQPHPGHSGSHQAVSRIHSGLILPYSSGYYGGYGYGKRSAEPYGYGVGLGYGVALTAEDRNNVWGHELASGYAINQPHPGHAGSHQAITKLHSGFGKRSILGHGVAVTVEDNNNLHGHELASGYAINQPHPGHSGSHQAVSRIHSGLILPYSSGYAFHG